ncbi:MAG: hypothetical protein JO001_07200 [Alphaproteobacteria bacterium]|nr:hypothetical protein [Alphaproteobacteria bacterium]
MTQLAERTADIYPSIAAHRRTWLLPAARPLNAASQPGGHIVRKFIAVAAFACGISTAAIAQMPAATQAIVNSTPVSQVSRVSVTMAAPDSPTVPGERKHGGEI